MSRLFAWHSCNAKDLLAGDKNVKFLVLLMAILSCWGLRVACGVGHHYLSVLLKVCFGFKKKLTYLLYSTIRKKCVHILIQRRDFQVQGPFLESPQKLFGPVKPFFVHQYLKTEKCVCLTSRMKGTYVHVKNT